MDRTACLNCVPYAIFPAVPSHARVDGATFGLGRTPRPLCGISLQLADIMIELLRTNDLVLISAVEAMLKEEGIGYFVADQFMSSVEGSLGFLPRRIMVMKDEEARARQILTEAGLAAELR